ncbi:CoA transferase [Rhodococcus sp. P-2]|uniref:CaiB/BaiF CoA transferase family protein n=1 Tax=Rhodococcus sp. P-2 TaxID=2795031 RepID=UPI001904F99F|nr:CaiB/BaiF CoA-transferase family protein [Rhodococcus sp. P-2]QQM20507.1 CoA transferase [Rhodococcus sp. P-2]
MNGANDTEWSFLHGKRVLDLSRLLPGPFATTLLADLGADVIKVEDPSRPDPTRETGGRMASLNRNKRSIALDLRIETDRETFLRLVETADAVVEGFRPQVLASMGLGYDILRKMNPRIVLCSISGYGQSGPYADKPGHELNFLGLSGFFAVPGGLDGTVTRPGIRAGDMVGSMYAALSIAVALASVDKHGHGQHIDVSLAEAATAWCAPFALMIRDIGNPTDSPTIQGDNDIFETSDGRLLSLATFEDKFWIEFRTALGDKFPTSSAERFDQRWRRTLHKAEVRKILVATFAAQTYGWWSDLLTTINAPWAPVFTDADQLMSDPHVVARELFSEISDDDGETWPQMRFPAQFSLGLNTFRLPMPQVGEHTEAILGELATAMHGENSYSDFTSPSKPEDQ